MCTLAVLFCTNFVQHLENCALLLPQFLCFYAAIWPLNSFVRPPFSLLSTQHFNVAIFGKACLLLLLEIMPSFSCTDPLLPWKSCPSSSCTDLPLSLGECALLLLLLSLLNELNLSLEKSDSSPSRSSVDFSLG